MRMETWSHLFCHLEYTRARRARGPIPCRSEDQMLYSQNDCSKLGRIARTDLKGPTGTRDFQVMGRTWTLITRGRVGFLLEDVWADWWCLGGSVSYASGDRVCGLRFPRQG